MMRSRPTRSAALAVTAAIVTFGMTGCFGHSSSAASPATTATQPAVAVNIGIDPKAMVDAAVPASLTAYLKSTKERAGVAVYDMSTGLSVIVNPHLSFQTASIVKMDILATRLLQHQKQGTKLSAHERSLATAMITESDNNAASALWRMDGQAAGVGTANKTFGMTETTPHGGGLWGETHTTPADQIALLKSVMDPSGPLNDYSRNYLLNLMSHVDKAQDWGVPAAATPSATDVYVKNGWDTIDAQGSMWGINSVGRITEPGHDWLVATLSSNHRTMPGGIKVIEQLSKMAVGGLRFEASLT
jgi:beta-lactamase class A